MLNIAHLAQLVRTEAPKSVFIDALRYNAGNNPIINNAIKMLENNDTEGIEMLCRNLCKEKGVDADRLLNDIKRQYGIK